MKKVLSLVLVLCLMASVTAFAGDEVLQGYVSTWDNYGLDKDPITLTIGCGSQDLPASYENNIQIELKPVQDAVMSMVFMDYDIYYQSLSVDADAPRSFLEFCDHGVFQYPSELRVDFRKIRIAGNGGRRSGSCLQYCRGNRHALLYRLYL